MVTEWFTHTSSNKAPDGVVLVLHGLNLNPIRMKAIISVLNEINLDVLLLSLQGHGNNYDKNPKKMESKARLNSFKKVRYQKWQQETQLAYDSICEKAKQFKCPLYFLGYSLGGLMGCDLILSGNTVSFKKMILFAPAITTHRVRIPFFRLLHLFPGIVIPSLSPEKYRSNRGTPIAAYLALLEALRNCKAKLNSDLNIPTIVFIDKKDELVSYHKLKSLVSKYQLNHWTIHKIERPPHQLKYPFHHLIIDEKSAGQKEWLFMQERMIEHLSS